MQVEKCKQRDLLEQLLAEMGEDYPHLSRIFVEERDAYMTHVLHSLIVNNTVDKRGAWRKRNNPVDFQPLRIVAVVGIGHTPGITSRWNEVQDITQLIRIPEQSTTSKVRDFTYSPLIFHACRSWA